MIKKSHPYPFPVFYDECVNASIWLNKTIKVKCAVNLDESITTHGMLGHYSPNDGIVIYMRNIYNSKKSKSYNMFMFITTMIHEGVHYLRGTLDRAKVDKAAINIGEIDCNLRVCSILKSIDPKDWKFYMGIDEYTAKSYITMYTMKVIANVYMCYTGYKSKYTLTINKEIINAVNKILNGINNLSTNFTRKSPTFTYIGGHE